MRVELSMGTGRRWLCMSSARSGLVSVPAIAPPPRRIRSSSDILRLLPYLKPYRVRWIAMVVAAFVSLAATVSVPLLTKAVIDGPVREKDSAGLWTLGLAATALLVMEAVLWFIRRWLVARATMGVEADIRKDLYARLQILPMSFHGNWQSGQLLSRVMNDLERHPAVPVLRAVVPDAQHRPDHRGDDHPAGDVLAAGRRRGGGHRADHPDHPALSAAVHAAVAAVPGPGRQRRHPRRGIRHSGYG